MPFRKKHDVDEEFDPATESHIEESIEESEKAAATEPDGPPYQENLSAHELERKRALAQSAAKK
jgi:hypothetical protein